MKKYKISLIIPAYNEEKYIGTCLQYALKNAGDDLFEIIVVANNSTDKTMEMAKKFSGVKVIRENKKGVANARQAGFKTAQGEILAFIDADTRMPANWSKIILKEFESNSKIVCLSGPYIYYDLSAWKKFLVTLFWYFLAMPAYFILGYLVIGGNFAIRKETLEKMSGFNTAVKFYGDDTDIAKRAHKFGKIKFNPGFIMYTSGRRLRGEGFLKIGIIYILNYVAISLLNRPLNKNHKDIR
ncbi:glycosyltransferase [Patescibacteria group bacterium]|nr:glycosyltransferase [Patescibacteria group bacterium]